MRLAAVALVTCAGLLMQACAGHRYVSGSDVPMADWHRVLPDCTSKPFVAESKASPVLVNLRRYARVSCVVVDYPGDDAWGAEEFYRRKFQEKGWRRILTKRGFMRFGRFQECAEVGVLPVDASYAIARSGGPPPKFLVLIFGVWLSALPNECNVRYAKRSGPAPPAAVEPAVLR